MQIKINENEYWWGISVSEGTALPLGRDDGTCRIKRSVTSWNASWSSGRLVWQPVVKKPIFPSPKMENNMPVRS